MLLNWRKKVGTALIVMLSVTGLGVAVDAAAPSNVVTYQGRVLNSNGVPVSDASLNMRFWLYTASAGGTCVWSNSSSDCDSNTPASTTTRSVSLSTGLFTQNLGDTGDSFASIPDSVFADNATIYLAVEIAGETLSPRKLLTAAPYALNAQRLDGIDSTGFLASDGDTATGEYDFTGAALSGASPLVFEGATDNAFETTFAFTDPTADRTITFQDASGTVAFTSSILWEDGTNGVFEDDEAVIVGTDSAFSFAAGGAGDLRVGNEIEVIGNGTFNANLIVGGSTSSSSTLSNGSFTLGGDDLFVAGDLGVEGVIYTDSSLAIGTSTTLSDGALVTTGTTDLALNISGGDITFNQNTDFELDGTEQLSFNNNGTGNIVFDLQSTGDLVFKDAGTTKLSWLDTGLLAFDPSALGLSMAGTSLDLDADRDTSISAATDDIISIDIGGTAGAVLFQAPQSADAASSTLEAIQEINLTTPADSTGTNSHAGLQMDVNVGNATGGTNTVAGIAFDDMTGDAQVDNLHAIRIGGLTETAASNESAIEIGNGWDAALRLLDSSDNLIQIADGSKLAIKDTSGNDIAIFQDVSANFNHTINVDSDTGLLFDSNADTDNDITTLTNEDLKVMAAGTGDTVFGVDGDTGVKIVAEGTTGSDNLLSVTNNGFDSTTSGTNGLDLYFGVSNTSGDAVNITPAFTMNGSDQYNAISIEPFTPSISGTGNTLHGLTIAAPSGADASADLDAHAIVLSNGWDSQIFFNDTSSVIELQNTGSLTFRDGTNQLAALEDNGIDGRFVINNIKSSSNSSLNLLGGDSNSTSAGQAINLTGGTNDTSTASGGSGGAINLTGGAAAGDGSVGRDGGTISLTGGDSSVGTGNAGDVIVAGGDSTGGNNGNVSLLSGGSPTAISTNGGDIVSSSSDDTILSADDDFSLEVTSASAIANLFDNAVAKTINIGGVTEDGTDTINIATNATSADTIEIGNNNASSRLTLQGGANIWNITSSGVPFFTLGTLGSYDKAVCFDGAGYSDLQDCTGAPIADYAEQYPVAEDVTYGDIVVPGDNEVVTMDGDTIAQVVKSSEPYQGPVVGIVSNNYGDFTSAGYNLYEEDNPMPVALVGRVPVKVTSEGGSISVGDYLTTSSTPGAAMKATRIGRVIGMALEDWDGVSETVMVQVNNSFYMGDVVTNDNDSTRIQDELVISETTEATASEPTFDSYGLALRGSAWDGSEAEAVSMMFQNKVDDENNYRLSISNTAETEVAYITNEGTMEISGDMVIGGRLYPSDRGDVQTDKYIYYDGSSGPGGDMMRTNAKGWGAGSYDFAEMFPSVQNLKAGEVVVFAGANESVKRSSGTDTERLAGIVSTRPGFLAGNNEEGAFPIALAGRVPTFVSTENGEISVGDALTASSTTGVAMKATDEGQIIGYALENYNGTGSDNMILVFVNVGHWNGVDEPDIEAENTASQLANGTTSFTKLNMSGDIHMGTNNILSIGRLEGISGWSIGRDGTIKTRSSLQTVTESYQGDLVATSSITSPEQLITLTGTAQLEDGQAEIRFEQVHPKYNDVISAVAPVRVVVTPNGPSSLYISEKDQNHFVVKSFGGSREVEFDWMVTAYRKGFEPEEQEVVVEEEGTDTTDAAETEDAGEVIESTESTEETSDEPEDSLEEGVEEVTEEELDTEEAEEAKNNTEETEQNMQEGELTIEPEQTDETERAEEADVVQETTDESVAPDEPAAPESPDTNLVDSTDGDDGGATAEEPLNP